MTKRYRLLGDNGDWMAALVIKSLELREGSEIDGVLTKTGETCPDGEVNPTPFDLISWETEDGWADLPAACFEEVAE